MQSISLFNTSPTPGLKMSSYVDFLRLSMQLTQHSEFQQLLIKFILIQSPEQKVTFLQQPNEFLSYNLMFYTLLYDRPFFYEHVLPLIEGRSEDYPIDVFLVHFSKCFEPGFTPKAELKQKVEDLYLKLVLGNANGLEILVILLMKSFYENIDALINQLHYDVIQDTHETNALTVYNKLRELIDRQEAKQQNQDDDEAPVGEQEERINYQNNLHNISERDKLFEEILYFKTNKMHNYEQVPWNNYLHFLFLNLLQKVNPKYDQSKLERSHCNKAKIFERIIVGSRSEVYLVTGLALDLENTQIQYGAEQNSDLIASIQLSNAECSVTCSIKGAKRQKNNYFTLSVKSQIQNNSSMQVPAQITVIFPKNCFSETIEQEMIINFQCDPYELSEKEINLNVFASSNEFEQFTVKIKTGQKENEFKEEKDTKVDYQFLKVMNRTDASILYMHLASEAEQNRYVQEMCNGFIQGLPSLLIDQEFAETLITIAPQQSIETLQPIIALIHKDMNILFANYLQKHVQAKIHECNSILLDALKIDALGSTISTDIKLQHYNSPNSFLEADFAGKNEITDTLYTLLIKDALKQCNQREGLQLAYMLILTQDFALAEKILEANKCELSKYKLLKCYTELARGNIQQCKVFYDQLIQQNLPIQDKQILDQISLYLLELDGQQQFAPQFSVSFVNNVYYFEKSPEQEVTINLHQLNPFNYNSEADYSIIKPSLQYVTKNNQFDEKITGLFQINFKCGENTVKMMHNSCSLKYEIDSENAIIHIQGKKQFYCQVQFNNQFYKDGFTDGNGYFDYQSVSDRDTQSGPFKLILVAQDGECCVIDQVGGGAQIWNRPDIINPM
ncbi:Conserved_hypothetical protein [Hexamita inflata]|uniref:Uncharacterized protein n=1 Tax=Hexamita inflata TaxID=28002 RepID=A0AA86UI55_9EUKA|nr:Conserved hypothetical protein [Hexamita inflata]